MSVLSIALVLTLAAAPQNQPPTVTIELEDEDGNGRIDVLQDVVIRVTVDDPDGDRVSADLAFAPQTLAMRPIANELPPVTRTLRWFVPNSCGGRNRVVVHAHDAAAPNVVARGELRFDVFPHDQIDASTKLLDVDGDDDVEVVVADAHYDVQGNRDAGAILVWDLENPPGSNGYAPQVLRASAPAASARLGRYREFEGTYAIDETVQQVDFDGDGVLDLIAASLENGGALHVWYGGPSSASDRPDDAVLTATPAAALGKDPDAWLFFHDVTGDGVEDVVALAPNDSASRLHSGAIHVFAGGARATGTIAPTATLRLASARAQDRLGRGDPGVLAFADVTGDGIDDVIAGAPNAARNGLAECGVAGVWAGGPGLVGTVLETAELVAAKPTANGEMGRRIHCGDLTGDGIDDVVVDAGETLAGDVLLLFKGGARMNGTPMRLAVLTVPLGDVAFGFDRVFVHDLDGDGKRDVLAWAPGAQVGATPQAGAGYLWSGASLVGRIRASATLTSSPPQEEAAIGGSPNGVRLVDVDGDGMRDVVAASPGWRIPSSGRKVNDYDPEDGALHVWRGGVAYLGLTPPTAELTATSNQPAELANDARQGFRVADVTGDGRVDLVVQARTATQPGLPLDSQPTVGGIMVFEGGPALAGPVKPIAALFAPVSIDSFSVSELGRIGNLLCEDVTGDGVDDVVALAPEFSSRSAGTPTHEGAAFVWSGGAALAGFPEPTAEFFGLSAYERLGSNEDLGSFIDFARGFHLADVTGDGTLDLLIGAPHASPRGMRDAGCGYVLEGGPGLRGGVAPLAILARAAPVGFDRLFGSQMSCPFLVGDLDSDGDADWLAPDRFANVAGRPSVGVLFWFPDARPASGGGAIELTAGQDDVGHWLGQ